MIDGETFGWILFVLLVMPLVVMAALSILGSIFMIIAAPFIVLFTNKKRKEQEVTDA